MWVSHGMVVGKLGRDCPCKLDKPFRAVMWSSWESSGNADWKDQALEISKGSKDAIRTWNTGPSCCTTVKNLVTCADVMTG